MFLGPNPDRRDMFDLQQLTRLPNDRALLCIPLSAVILDSLGTRGFILIFGGVLLVALGAFTMARWSIQGYVWKWKDAI